MLFVRYYDIVIGYIIGPIFRYNVLLTDYNPYSTNLAGVHDRSHVPSQSFSKAAVLTIAVKVLGMLQHTNPLSLN